MATTGERIALARKHAGLTQMEFGAILGVSQTQVANWESGYRTPKPETVEAIAERLRVGAAWLVGWAPKVLFDGAMCEVMSTDVLPEMRTSAMLYHPERGLVEAVIAVVCAGCEARD